MQYSDPVSPEKFTTFGDLLKYLRRREQLTQLELSIKVGYSEAQISRLEKNQRLPDPTGVIALFIPTLHMEDEPAFATRLVELAQSARQAAVPAPGISPYKGLLYFDEPDAELFFGREGLTAQLVQHVMDLALDASLRFLAVVGASGSGKSSVVRAGMAVALRKVGWEVLAFTPGVHPLQALEGQMKSLPREDYGRVLILVDQFEEVYTLCRDELERIAFIDRLLSSAQEKSRQYSVVIALRADFYAHCSQYPILRQAVAGEQEYIGQMSLEELRQAIEEPARRNGWELEPGLVDVMLQDLSTHGSHEPEPGALPLLSHALLATWENRRGHTLTLSGYHASGGLRGAIAETAESVFTDQLNGAQQEIAREVFLRLTELGEGTADTRRRAALAELGRQFEETAQFRVVLNTLAERRLITLNEDSAEVAHEALIREWQRLHEWLTQDREGLLLHRHLTEATQDWERRGWDASELYRGARLAQASEWASTNEVRLNSSEHDFLAASVEQEHHEALENEAQRQRELEAAQNLAEAERQRVEEHKWSEHHLRRRAIYLGFALAGAFLLLLVAIIFARQSNQNYAASQEQAKLANQNYAVSQEQAQLATARELAAASLNNLEVDQERSLLLAMQAVKTVDIPEAENSLHQAILSMRLRDTLFADKDPIYGIAYYPGGTQDSARIATASQDGTIKIWSLDNTGMKINETPLITISNPTDFDISAAAAGYTLAFSPDGKQLAGVSSGNSAKIWDTATGRLQHTLNGHTGNILSVSFSPRENLVATGSEDRTFRIWDSQSGKELQTVNVGGNGLWAAPVVFSDNGMRLACGSAGGTLTVWHRSENLKETANNLFIRSFDITNENFLLVSAIAFSHDGNQLAFGLNDIYIFDISTATLSTPAKLLLDIPAHPYEVIRLFYTQDGTHLISASYDGTAKVWDAHTGQQLMTLAGNAGPMTSATHSIDGQTVYAAYKSGEVKAWDLSETGNQEWLTYPYDLNEPQGIYTRPGNLVVNIENHGYFPQFQELELSPAGAKDILNISAPNVMSVFDVDQDLKRMVMLNPYTKNVEVWDLTTKQRIRKFTIKGSITYIYESDVNTLINIKLSPDGSLMATGGQDGTVYLWDVETGTLLHSLIGQTAGFGSWDSIVFSPDGTLLATANYDGRLRIWDVATGDLLHDLPGHKGAYPAVSFSPDGKRLLATGEGTTINLWDVNAGQIIYALTGYPTSVCNLDFSPDGKYFAAGMINNNVYVWDASTGQELLTLPGIFVRFTADGKHLLALDGGILYGYDLEVNELMELARSRLTRTWTQYECEKYLYTDVCPPAP